MQLQIVSESQIDNSLDAAIKQILCICFPEEKDILSKVNYWHSVPAWRVILKEGQKLIGHVAIVDRTIRIGQSLARVAGGQGVSLLPEYRGKGLCDRMFEAVTAEALRQGFDFGMLFCYPVLETIYLRYDYRILADRAVTLVDKNGKEGPLPEKNITMWCPLAKKDFSPGDIHLQGNDW